MKRRKLLWAISPLALALSLPASGSAAPPSTGSSLQLTASSPFAGCTSDAVAAQTGTNYPNSELEPRLVLSPSRVDRNADGLVDESDLNIVVTHQQDRWSNSGARGVVAEVSMDGGASWQTTPIPGITKCSGGTWDRASNPWLSFGPQGDVYHSALVLNKDKTASDILVSRSGDGGLSWGAPSSVAGSIGFNDKPSITADALRPGNVYVVWQRQDTGSTLLGRSTDGGSTWEPPRAILAKQVMGAEVLSHPSGALLMMGGRLQGPNNRNSAVVMLKSTDAGATWSAEKVVAAITTAEVTDPESRAKVRTSGTWSIPSMAMDTNPSSPGFGNVYAVWEDGRFGGTSKTKFSSIAFSMSADAGTTWSSPIKVNQTPTNVSAGNQQAFTPSVAVAENGSIGVSYYDLRNNSSSRTTLLADRWLAHCHPATAGRACASSGDWRTGEARVTDSSFDLSKAPNANGYFLGDYEGLAGGSDGSFFSAHAASDSTDPASLFFRTIDS